MSDYTKLTNFAAKDSLVEGDPNKIIKGTEIDAEFIAIQTAVSTKADLLSPTFTGAPRAPTVSFGDSSTKIATTAFVQQALQAIYPVGSIYINASSSTNPATIFGFGTWTVFGEGRVLVGQQSSDALFDTLGETGGSKDAVIPAHTHTFTSGNESVSHTHTGTTSSESANHTHTFSATSSASGVHSHNISDPGHTHGYNKTNVTTGTPFTDHGGSDTLQYWNLEATASSQTGISIFNSTDHTHTISGTTTGTSTTHTHTVTTGNASVTHTHSGTTDSTGVSVTNTNVQPYVVVKMWQRTA